MKNVFFALVFILIGVFSFASTEDIENESDTLFSISTHINGVVFYNSSSVDNIKLYNDDDPESLLCRVSCSINLGGVVFTASAGNFLSSCKRAGKRCAKKLAGAVGQFYSPPEKEQDPGGPVFV